MRNNINIINCMRRGLLSFFFILSTAAYGATYYVDATGGNDGNSGSTKELAWKSLSKVASKSYLPGDKILFKRGETFVAKSQFEFDGSSGDENSPIIIDAYGTGNKPIITPLQEQVLSWSNQGGNIWRASVAANPKRLLRDGVELLNAVNSGEMDGSKYHWYWSSQYLYIKMSDNPSNHKIEFSKSSHAFIILGEEHINISNIDFQGGYSYCVYLTSSNYITLSHCNIGKYANKGIQVAGTKASHHCVIEYSNIDSHYKFTFTGSADRGAREGVLMQGPSTYNHIRYNTIKNWVHANINMYNCHDNKVYGNYSTAPDLSAGGRITLDGTSCYNNEIYNNTFKNYHSQNQINGHDNHIHHNIFDGMKDANIGSYYGRAIDIAAYNSPVYNNIIEFNKFLNVDRAAIRISSNNRGNLLDNITIRNNIIENCGIKKDHRAITITTGGSGPDATNINISGNDIYNSSTDDTVYYYGVTMTVNKLNLKALANSNTVNEMLNLTSIGSSIDQYTEQDSAVEPTATTVEPTATTVEPTATTVEHDVTVESSTYIGPFKMSKEGLE